MQEIVEQEVKAQIDLLREELLKGLYLDVIRTIAGGVAANQSNGQIESLLSMERNKTNNDKIADEKCDISEDPAIMEEVMKWSQ